jgi:hypothetical protein
MRNKKVLLSLIEHSLKTQLFTVIIKYNSYILCMLHESRKGILSQNVENPPDSKTIGLLNYYSANQLIFLCFRETVVMLRMPYVCRTRRNFSELYS